MWQRRNGTHYNKRCKYHYSHYMPIKINRHYN